MPQLHETGYGRRLFEHELPELNKSLSRIANALEKIIAGDNKSAIPQFQKVRTASNHLQDILLEDIFSANVRISNALKDSKILNLYQLVKLKEKDLLKTRNFGAKCLWEVKKYLSEIGLKLEME